MVTFTITGGDVQATATINAVAPGSADTPGTQGRHSGRPAILTSFMVTPTHSCTHAYVCFEMQHVNK